MTPLNAPRRRHAGSSTRVGSARIGTARTAFTRTRAARTGAARTGFARTGLGAAAALTAALFLLTGCKSANSQGNNPAPGAPPAAPSVPPGSGSASPNAAGSADFSYGGAVNDSAHLTSSTCAVSSGDVVSFRAPASGSTPALSGTKSGQSWTVTLNTATHSAYTASGATGITTSDDGGARSVSLDGVTLASGSGSVTLSGTVLCGRGA